MHCPSGPWISVEGCRMATQHIWVWAPISCLQRTPCYVRIISKKNLSKKALPKAVFSLEAFLPFFGQYKSDCVFCHARKGQDQNKSFRKFPLNNAELLQKWIAAMAVKDFVPNKRSVLCSEHFEKDCFRKTGPNACTLTLMNNVIPTIFKLLLINKTTAGERNRNSPEEISAAYEGREKRRLSVDLPPPKTDTKYSMVNSMRTSTSDSGKKQWQVQRNGQTPTTSRRIRHIVYDHRYETTPMREKMLLPKKRIQALMLEKHANNYQHISRLKQQVTSLKQIPYSSFQIIPTLIKL